jgi:hypothetical protein
MIQNISTKLHFDDDKVAPKPMKSIDDLIRKGIIKTVLIKHHVIYGITQDGDVYTEQIPKKEKKTIEILP